MATYGPLHVKAVKYLLNIPAGLKKLELDPIHLVCDGDPVDELPTILCNFLQKQALTLEHISIHMQWDHQFDGWQWNIPVFPGTSGYRVYDERGFRMRERSATTR